MTLEFRHFIACYIWARALWCPCKELEMAKKPRPGLLHDDWVVHPNKVQVMGGSKRYMRYFCPREKVFWTEDPTIVVHYEDKWYSKGKLYEVDCYSHPEWWDLEHRRHVKGEEIDL